MLTGLQLPLRFDPAGLRADLARIAESEWSPHYNERDYGGDWRGVALRSASGSPGELRASAPEFRDTPLLDRCRHFREVAAAFDCPLKSIRLLSLAPGSFIREHSDNALDFEDGEARIHVPIQTNLNVEFYVCGERLLLEEGQAYYVNVNLPHRVNNRGGAARVHLVIDVEVNDWLRALFERSSPIRRGAAPERGVDAFREAVLLDSGLCETLRPIADRAEFSAAAVRLGSERRFEFHEGDVEAILSGAPRPGPPGGLPCSVSVRDGKLFATWIDTGGRELTEPFFEDTVRLCLRDPFVRFSRREAELPEAAGPAPCGLIFHLSRCGSTLLARLFQAAGYRVISEAPPIDQTIGARRVDWLRSVAAALGGDRPYVLKLDAWHIHELPLFRAAFPDTPWVFLYRDPVEVLVSQLRSPGRHALPGAMDPRALAMQPEDITALQNPEWCARVLAAICRSALRSRDGLFVDYRDLPEAAWSVVAGRFGIRLNGDQVARMQDAARVHAKDISTPFVPDSAGKQAEGHPLAGLIASTGLDRLYGELSARATPSAERSAPPRSDSPLPAC